MQSDGEGSGKPFPGFETLKRLKQMKVPGFGNDPIYREYQDTLRRLLKGDFEDLGSSEKELRVEQIISLSSTAAMATASVPVPFLEMPVQVAMVQAIAKVHGVKKPGKQVLLRLAVTAGGGLLLRQLLRLVPGAGALPLFSRIYGATWALGRASNLFFSGAHDEQEIKQVFETTLEEKTEEEADRMREGDFEARFKELQTLREQKLITEAEYQEKRKALLSEL